MDVKCLECGEKTIVGSDLIKNLLGGTLVTSAALGWVSYAFAGLLGFYGGAAVIATALLAGGGLVLTGKDLGLVVKIGNKITDILNQRRYACPSCGEVNWSFSGYQKVEIVRGAEHKRELMDAIANSRKELFIASGFLSSNVVTTSFLAHLEECLKRGVSVKLIFSDSNSHSDWMFVGYAQALKELRALNLRYSNLQLIRKHTHQKGLVVDQKYAVVGSFNFLSNQKSQRDETSAKVFEEDGINELRKEFLVVCEPAGK